MSDKPLELRDVDVQDCEDLYQWRNHPIVRKASFDSEPFSRESHEQWFQKKRNDPETTIYIAHCDGNKIGVIRFEETKEAFQVNVMLNPEFIGQGFGARLIKEGARRLVGEKTSSKPIVAEIKPDNEASQKAFAQAGFKVSHSTYTFEP